MDTQQRWKHKDKFLKSIIDNTIKNRKAKVLVICGGSKESRIFSNLGFINVTITNINSNTNSKIKYNFKKQNALHLNYTNNSFDYVFVNDGLHHCSSPHKALLEMYRVARIGALGIESKDSYLMRLLVKLKITNNFELSSLQEGSGGVDGTYIPNYVYRWTKREIEKTIKSYDPMHIQEFSYRYYNVMPLKIYSFPQLVRNVIFIMSKIIFFIFRNQQNLFSFYIKKSKQQQPWFNK